MRLNAIVQASGVTEIPTICEFDWAEESTTMPKVLRCGISLDDFGAAFSSLGHEDDLPLDKLEVDRSFVAHINDNPNCCGIIK